MTFWARSWLSQNVASPIKLLSRSRSAALPATSKRVPELGQAGAQVVGSAAKVGIHSADSSIERGRAIHPPIPLDVRIAKEVQLREANWPARGVRCTTRTGCRGHRGGGSNAREE